MLLRKIESLDRPFTVKFDAVDESGWYAALQKFEDANIYQTWAYGTVVAGRGNVSRLVLKDQTGVVAMAQVRIARVPWLPVGMAYVLWGPVWKCNSTAVEEIFRHTIRALRNEFVCRQGLTLRLFPMLQQDDDPSLLSILEGEKFSSTPDGTLRRTIIMNLVPPLDELRSGMKAHWQRELKIAERNNLEVIEGTGPDLFNDFVKIYREMVSRKRFAEPNDINQFLQMQQKLPEPLKMRIMLCKSGESVCAGAIWSVIGRTALYLFGATSDAGMKSRGSYLLQWKFIEQLKKRGITTYDLNGVNPERNPGTYKFKSDLAGRHGKEMLSLGRFDCTANWFSSRCVYIVEKARRARWADARAVVKTALRTPGSHRPAILHVCAQRSDWKSLRTPE
jgi:lipid II:glycine glycyltransferase (peptidoglycan interpeptide bridge formation enzyme)